MRLRKCESSPKAVRLVSRLGVTPRGLQFMRLMSEGLSFVDIADKLKLSVKTVDNTMQTNYRRINVNSDTAAVAWYIRNIERPL